MLSSKQKTVYQIDIDDEVNKNRFSLKIDSSAGWKVSLSMQHHCKRSPYYMPEETVLTITDPTELEALANILIEIMAEAGLARIEETD